MVSNPLEQGRKRIVNLIQIERQLHLKLIPTVLYYFELSHMLQEIEEKIYQFVMGSIQLREMMKE